MAHLGVKPLHARDRQIRLMTERILVLTAALLLAIPALGQKPLSYSSTPFSALGGAPPAAIADFNGDGKLDIVGVPAGVPPTPITLLLGNGDGTFRQGPPLPIAVFTYSIAAGDLNGDGKPDLAVCYSNGSPPPQLHILLNRGDGTFRLGQSLGVCNGPLSIADFNADGKADIYDAGVSLWLGNGDGSFNGPTALEAGLPRDPIVADFNGDGLPDLAALAGGDQQHQAQVWLNRGAGQFAATPELAVSFTTPYGSTNSDSLAAGDFNGDGKAALALLTPTGQLKIFLSNGDGTFRPGASYAFTPGTIGIYAQDMDGDGRLDLVVTAFQVMILRGNGDGTFAAHVDICTQGALGSFFDLGGNSGALAFGDFNGDGVLDMIDYPRGGFGGSNKATTVMLSGAPIKPAISAAGLVNAATYVSGSVSAGGLVTAYGENLGVAACGGLGEELLFNGTPAGILYASPTQINAQVPWEIAGATEVQVTPLNNGAAGATITIAGAPASPGIFTISETGSGQGTIVPAGTHMIATPENPAERGKYATIYGTGLGLVTNQPITGEQSPWDPMLAQTTALPVVTVGGINAQVTWSGLVPGFVGLYQVNFIVPENAPTGNAVAVSASVGRAISNAVTMAVQ